MLKEAVVVVLGNIVAVFPLFLVVVVVVVVRCECAIRECERRTVCRGSVREWFVG